MNTINDLLLGSSASNSGSGFIALIGSLIDNYRRAQGMAVTGINGLSVNNGLLLNNGLAATGLIGNNAVLGLNSTPNSNLGLGSPNSYDTLLRQYLLNNGGSNGVLGLNNNTSTSYEALIRQYLLSSGLGSGQGNNAIFGLNNNALGLGNSTYDLLSRLGLGSNALGLNNSALGLTPNTVDRLIGLPDYQTAASKLQQAGYRLNVQASQLTQNTNYLAGLAGVNPNYAAMLGLGAIGNTINQPNGTLVFDNPTNGDTATIVVSSGLVGGISHRPYALSATNALTANALNMNAFNTNALTAATVNGVIPSALGSLSSTALTGTNSSLTGQQDPYSMMIANGFTPYNIQGRVAFSKDGRQFFGLAQDPNTGAPGLIDVTSQVQALSTGVAA